MIIGKPGMNLRKLSFFTLDAVQGGRVRKATADLEVNFNAPEATQAGRIDRILSHATSTTPAYKTLLGCRQLQEFPLLQKDVIKKNIDEYFSESFKAKLPKLRKATTSGSYGTPFTFYLSPEKRARMIAEVYFFGRSSDFAVGIKHAYIISKNKPRVAQIIQNQVMVTVDRLDDTWCKDTIRLLRDARVKVLVGYPSAIARLGAYLQSRNETLRMDGVITIAEVLTDEMRSSIASAFECRPVSRYSTEEFGVLGNQDLSGEFFWLNQVNYVIEVIALDSDKPAEIGELGRIVVTDLYSDAMPLIRYDIGDLAKPVEIRDGLVTKIESVEGRRLELIRDVDGGDVSPFMINSALRESAEVVQFQFSQEAERRYLLKIVAGSVVDEDSLRAKYQGILGGAAEIVIEYVDGIPALPSGKRPYIIQNYY